MKEDKLLAKQYFDLFIKNLVENVTDSDSLILVISITIFAFLIDCYVLYRYKKVR